MKYEKITILMTLAMLLFICSLSTISAANINVDNSTSSIKQGLDSAAPSGDTILLAPGNYTGTNNTGLTISKNVTIQGNGPTEQVIIDAQKLNRMFIIGNGYNVTFINITFINGNTSTNGGSIYNNYANSMITILNCQFINNTAAAHAGAIYNIGNNMTVSDSIFTGNTATGSSSGGGAIQNRGNNTVIANSTFNDNVAGNYGGAIHSEGDNFVIANSTFTNNRAISSGGALWLRGNGYGHNVTVINSTFESNICGMVGGAIASHGETNIINSTFIDNNAGDLGGAVLNGILGSMILSGNTMVGNIAGNAGNMIQNNGTMGVLSLTYLSNSTVITSKGSIVTIYATLTDDMGNTVTGQNISFYVDGMFIANVTSIEGKANTTYLVTKGPVSVLPVTGDYAGHDGYSIIIKNGQLLIPKIPTNITIDVPEKVKVGENATIESKLTDKDGNPIANATIDFYVDGKKIGSAITDENGVAKINHIFSKAGKPTITAKYAGNETYEASNANDQTIVSKIKTNLELETDENTITATLTDENRNPLANKKITIKIKGKTFTGITDANGQVIIKFLNANKYKVTAKFTGDDQYAPSSATVPGKSEPNELTSNALASGKITMKSTGIPIIAALLVLIASFGLVLRKRLE